MRWVGFIVVLLLVLAVGAQQPAQVRPRLIVDDEFRPTMNAIDRGLEYLRRNQNPNGSWSARFGGVNMVDPWAQNPRAPKVNAQGDYALTALSIMAFLSAGHVPGEGPYGDSLTAAIQWMLENQQRDGRLCPTNGTEMYHHGICTLMLAEVVGLTSSTYSERLREALERAVLVILTAQRRGGNNRFGQGNMVGGWRYSVSDSGFQGSDLSVTGWQLMALRAAKNVGCDVPVENIQAAVDYVKRSQDKRSGGFQYQPGGQVTVPCTGVGVLCLELSGKDYHLCDEALKGGSYILANSQQNQAHYYYGVYYMSQAMFQLGGNYWSAFRTKLHRNLLELNGPAGDGSWSTVGDGGMYGGNYSTAMAILALTVEYRYLPIYQRFEEPLERDGRE
jgi:hypothetical protein